MPLSSTLQRCHSRRTCARPRRRSERSNRSILPSLSRERSATLENSMTKPSGLGEAYGRKLIEAGVEVVTTRYNATIHDFVMLNALAAAAPTRAAVTQAVDFLKTVLAPKR